MKSVSIALLGCGTVGKGVVDLLAMNGPLIEEQLDTKINIKRILIRDLNKYEKMEGSRPILTTSSMMMKSRSSSKSWAAPILQKAALNSAFGAERALSAPIKTSSQTMGSPY